MVTEAAMLLRAGNVEEWQSHFFSKPKAIAMHASSYIGSDIETFNPYGHIESPGVGVSGRFVQNCTLSQADTVLSNDA
jgi:hypothetical protein